MKTRNILALISKDIQLEIKQRYALNGIFLYIVSTIFITYLSFGKIIEPHTWNALFWIIVLFTSVNAVSKSFVQESYRRQLYYYTLVNPREIIVSKIIYNLLLMAVISFLSLIVFIVLFDSFIVNYKVFAICLFLGSSGFSAILTMVSAIASRTGNNFALMAILSFPIALPLLLSLIKVAKNALTETTWAENQIFIIVLFLINIIVFILSYILFPFLWRD